MQTVTADPVTGLPDLLYGEAETELRAAVRALLDDRCGWRDVLARTETGQPYDTSLWGALAAGRLARRDQAAVRPAAVRGSRPAHRVRGGCRAGGRRCADRGCHAAGQ